MKVTILTSVLCLFSGLVSSIAIPTPKAEAKPSTIEAREVIDTIRPALIVNIYEDAPTTAFGASLQAEVSKHNGRHSMHSLHAYTFTTGYPGRSCRFTFSGATSLYGTNKVQLYTVGGPILETNTFESRPHRDQYLGTFNARSGYEIAVWDDHSPAIFPCPTEAVTLNYEAVAQGDDNSVTWHKDFQGLVMEVY